MPLSAPGDFPLYLSVPHTNTFLLPLSTAAPPPGPKRLISPHRRACLTGSAPHLRGPSRQSRWTRPLPSPTSRRTSRVGNFENVSLLLSLPRPMAARLAARAVERGRPMVAILLGMRWGVARASVTTTSSVAFRLSAVLRTVGLPLPYPRDMAPTVWSRYGVAFGSRRSVVTLLLDRQMHY